MAINESQNWIVQFGDYDLRDINAGYSNQMPAFSDSTSSIYGSDGAVQNFGTRANPKTVSAISLTLIFVDDNSTDLQQQIDDFSRAHDGSMKRLFYAPYGTTDQQFWRYTYAKPTVIDDSRPISSGITHVKQVTYSIHDPYWYSSRFSDQVFLDEGYLLDSAQSFSGATMEDLSAGGSFTIRNEGSARALPVLVFDNNSGTLGNFVFQRIKDTIIADEFTYAGTVNTTGNKQLIVNARTNYVSDLANFTVTPGQQHIMQLLPGDNVLKLASAGTLTGTPQVHVCFEWTWH